jgi:RNA polymerase sigma factor (sigma-70 family)
VRSLTELYTKHKGPVYGYLRSMCGHGAEAEELTQETFYQAVLSLHRFRGDSAVLTWLLKIARNVYLKAQRRRPPSAPEAAAQTPDPRPGPEQQLIAAEDAATVHRVLAQLPEQYRTALLLREMQGFSNAEVAAILEKTEPTVRALVHRARERFRSLYLERKEDGQ